MKNNFWEPRFEALATYNAEVARGIVHRIQYALKMEALQKEYNEKRKLSPV